MFHAFVENAKRVLDEATDAHSRGRRDLSLRKLQQAIEDITRAGESLDGVAPKELPLFSEVEMWGYPGGKG